MPPRTGKPGSRRWRPARVRTTDRGILWAGLWSCVAIASLCHVGILAGFAQAATAATQDLGDLLLPDPEASVPTGALDDPQHVYPAGPAQLVVGSIPQDGTLPGELFFVPWLVFVAASHVAWLALLAAPCFRGPGGPVDVPLVLGVPTAVAEAGVVEAGVGEVQLRQERGMGWVGF